MITLRKVMVVAFLLGTIVSFIILSFNPASFSSALVLQTTKPPIPEPYYTSTRNPELTYDDLERVVFDASMPHEYERDVFDCTEGSAYMEWYLENKGFDTIIKKWNRHAYVIVRLSPNDNPCINSFLDSGRAQFFGHCRWDYVKDNYEYENIYEALRYEDEWHENISPGWKREYSEWDWWTEVNFTAVNS